MTNDIKKILRKNRIDGRKVGSIAKEISEYVAQKYARDNVENDPNYIPRDKESFIHHPSSNNAMKSGKKGVTLNQTGND